MAGNELSEALTFGRKLSVSAGTLLQTHFEKIQWEHGKGNDPRDLVTNADYASQKFIFKAIHTRFPNHGIYGEESGELHDAVKGNKYTWVVDPLDATVNFATGLHLWCVAMAVVDSTGEPQASFIYCPPVRELFYAQKGKGAFMNGSRIKVSTKPFRDSVVSVGVSHHAQRGVRAVKLLGFLVNKVRRVRLIGSSSLELAYTACGRFGGCVNFSSSDWDVLPGKLIVQEAGGLVRGVWGEKQTTPKTGFMGASRATMRKLLPYSKQV